MDITNPLWSILYGLAAALTFYIGWCVLWNMRLPWSRLINLAIYSGQTLGFLGLALSRWLLTVHNFDYRWIARCGFTIYCIGAAWLIGKHLWCNWRHSQTNGAESCQS
jgi:hypothetical protein